MAYWFAKYLTVEQAYQQYKKSNGGVSPFSREQLTNMAHDDSTCDNCDTPVWRMAGTGMCFTCTTGESDSSDDYELKPLNV